MFLIDPMSRVPIYEQITSQTETLLLCGAHKAGDMMPSVRSLSVSLSVNPNTVQRAYTDLCQKGLLYSVPGKGCFVSGDALDRLRLRNAARLNDFTDTVRSLRLAGVERSTLIERIESVYREGGDGDASGRTHHQAL